MSNAIEIKNGEARVSLLKLVQTSEFEGRMGQLAAMATRPVRRRLSKAGYFLPSGIYSGEKLAAEYRNIMTQKSTKPSAIRQDIQTIGNVALQACVDEAEEKLRASQLAESQKKASTPKPRTQKKAAAPKKKEAKS